MKILALNPPFLPKYSRESRSPAVAKSGTLYYPMWLAYAVGYLEKQGHEILFIDAPAKGISLDEVIVAAQKFGPHLAIVDTSTPSIYADCEAGEKLKEVIPQLFITLVGVHVSALPLETLAEHPQIDSVAFGEYDATVVELAAKLATGKTDEILASISGLAFQNSTGTAVKNAPRPFIENLDDIPNVSEVYKKHLDISPYFYGHSRHPIVVIVTGRGCPFHCTYCVIPQTLMGHAYRRRSVDKIVEEFAYIAENFPNAKEIMIEDDTFTADKARCREFSQKIIDKGLTKIPWSANSRADVDLDTMKIMHKAGCRLFCVGFESGEQRILDNIKKATNLPKIRIFIREAKKAKILIHGCFMVGNRGETNETLETTLKFAKELSPDTAQFFPIMVYPGTADYSYYSEKGWIITSDFRKWLTSDGLHSSVISNPDLTYETLVAFCDRARKEFYLRPSYIISKFFQLILQPKEAKRILMAGKTLARYLFSPSLKRT